MNPPFTFDDRSDVAALVYRAGENPDGVLAGFLRDLHGQGFDAVGLLQRSRTSGCGDAAFALFPPDDPPDAPRYGRVGDELDDRARRLVELLEERPDILVLNRFGWQEANGAGLLDVLARALVREVPVVIAVPEPLFAHWLDLTGGLSVRLPCDRAKLDSWWRSLWQPHPPGTMICERDK
ncbi:hypothetical protein CRT60_11745 [Azospirillum palustre]|uniref:DUF2478 domain-containing protein n=1 Tax=Azospirillum palustre TaxID=2044885 RepID=A0A2B8BFM3_9PROT|nr:DUF2478 domain-containing protein [Azospirillum palustre]PGH57546.1 hypothetical protein CRT60_11745 [Azospirillum palustre]